MPSSPTATVQLGTYDPRTDAFTMVLDLNDGTNIFQLTNFPEIDLPELKDQRASNPRSDGERVTNLNYGNRHVTLRMGFGKALTYTAIRTLISSFVAITSTRYAQTNGAVVLRYAPPSPSPIVNYSYFDVVKVTHDADKLPAMRILNGTARINAIFECAPFIRGDRQWLQNLVLNPGFEHPAGGGIATTMVTAFSDPFANVSAYTVVSGSAPTVGSNLMTVAGNSTITFGSPAWRAISLWQFRFKWVTGNTIDFVLHYTDASNYLTVSIDGTKIYISHRIAGVYHDLTTPAAALVNGNFYWITATQFPTPSATAPYISAAILNDSAGSIGSSVATAGPVATFDSVTALVGKMAIVNRTGTALTFGGPFVANLTNFVALFGPGAIGGLSNGAGVVSVAWDGTRPEIGMSGAATTGVQTYPNSPVASFGSLRFDFPPAGTPNATVYSYNGGTPTGTVAMPVRTALDVIGYSIWTQSSGLAGSASITIQFNEYNSSGTFLRQTLTTKTGNQATFSQFSGTFATGANCAYIGIGFNAADTGATSASGTVWFDNAQLWNLSETGMATMPYCELRFPNSPGQLLLSGLQGEVASPARFVLGTWTASALAAGSTLSFYIGLRERAGAQAILSGTGDIYTNLLDTASFGGAVSTANVIGSLKGIPLLPKASDMVGVYRVLMRIKTTQITGNLPATTAQVVVAIRFSADTGGVGAGYGRVISPAYSTSAAYQITDAGLTGYPATPISSAHDLTSTITSAVSIDFEDPAIGANTISWNWEAMVPADNGGSLLIGQVTIPSAFGVAAGYQVVIDGLNAQLQRNDVDVTAMLYPVVGFYTTQLYPERAAYSAGVAGTAANGGKFGVILGQDSIPQVNPTVNQASVLGVNQGVVIMTDNAAAVYPASLDVVYTPLFLYPRS